MNLSTKSSSLRISSPFISGLFYAMICMLLATLAASIILSVTKVEEQSLNLYIYVIHCLSLFVGGFVAGRRSGGKGWYYGGIMGVIYAVIILLVGFLGFDAVFKAHRLMFIVLAFMMGALGGILGVNTKK